MKELGMSWEEIKSTPRYELEGLLRAMNIFETIHAYDGYSSKDISHMAKDKPEVRSRHAKSLQLKEKYEVQVGLQKPKKQQTSLRSLLG
tara:strand:- start:11744 stop:12010 length:267 start_codon:yes stop_codon:yes gene_type:complete